MMQEFLDLKGISFRFKELSLFKDFNLVWPKNAQRVGVIGPNGSGKSTLFKIISGEIQQQAGDIFFFGENITRSSLYERNKKGIAKTFQHPSPFHSLTVFENVHAATLEHHNQKDRTSITNELLSLFKIDHKQTYHPRELNLLELRLLEMARSFATNPKLILLDECMVGFSNEEIHIFCSILKNIQKNTNVKIAIVEHNLFCLKEFCDFLIVLNLGEVVASGSVADCFQNEIVQKIYFP
ncbi:MAG: Lipopolysaccharide export system ATP-binding protein LptB [Holosporales bacterium]